MALRRSRTSGGALDFVSASLPCGRRVRILTMITLTMIDRIVADDFSREGLAAGVDPSLPGIRVGCERDRIAGRPEYTCRGCPTTSYARNDWSIWHQVIVASRLLDTFERLPQFGVLVNERSLP